ncbi:MAG: helix-turn-helix domain-containing protein [Roseicyclus sp.]
MNDPTDDTEVGRRLQALRALIGLNKKDMADANGIDITNYGRFEAGARPLPQKVALRLAERYDVTLDWLYRGRWGGLPLEVADRLRKRL